MNIMIFSPTHLVYLCVFPTDVSGCSRVRCTAIRAISRISPGVFHGIRRYGDQ